MESWVFGVASYFGPVRTIVSRQRLEDLDANRACKTVDAQISQRAAADLYSAQGIRGKIGQIGNPDIG
jgi:hypothetical protein